jgi:aminoglycoside phosphotransferase family enzyme
MRLKQKDIVLHLNGKEAYSHGVSRINVLETHISWIFLTGKYAYKVKKDVKLGQVLDFSNLSLRRKFCKMEVMLNKELCCKMYQGVMKIVKDNGEYKVVNLHRAGKPIEYAIKMVEIPQRFRMDNLVNSGAITKKEIDELTEILVGFHKHCHTSRSVAKFGKPQALKSKIKENFLTISKLAKIDSIFEERLNQFVEDNKILFEKRMKGSRIRDIHGDLYLKNIFYFKNRFYLYDRIEFNDFLRYADVAEDVAHLAMDFDYHKREDLRDWFISLYIQKSKDATISRILYFLMCYKACMRAKVSLFRASQLSNEREKQKCNSETRSLFIIARKYLEQF